MQTPSRAEPRHRRRPAQRLRLAGLLVGGLLAAFGASAFDLQGHRGARGLAPENTLPAFERALAIGVTTLELDIGLTADDVVVIAHDTHLNPAIARDADGRWLPSAGPAIRSLTWAQLQTYDVGRLDPATAYARNYPEQQPYDGTRVPSLASLFERVKALGAGSVRFNIETKLNPERPDDTASPERFVERLLAVIERAGLADRVAIQSFDWRTLKLVRERAPAIPTVCLTIQTSSNDNTRDGRWTLGMTAATHGPAARMAKAAGCSTWSPNAGALTPALLAEARALGLTVIPWTVNQPADMERLIGWGVDGLITDHPDRLRTAMARAGLALPAPLVLPPAPR